MNEVTTTTQGGALTTAYDPFAAAARDMGAIEGKFLKFDGNTGAYTVGGGDSPDELDSGTRVVIDMTAIDRGWTCWKDSEVIDESFVNLLAGSPPAEADLKDHGPYEEHDDGTKDGWHETTKLRMRVVDDGENKGVALVYAAMAEGARRSIANFIGEYARQYKAHPGESPIVELGESSFTPKALAKKRVKKYAPVLKLVGWLKQEDVDSLIAAAPAEEAGGDTEGAEDPSNYEANEGQKSPEAGGSTDSTKKREKRFGAA